MLASEILADQDGALWLGPAGEKRYGRRNFSELYAVFSTPRTLTVRWGAQEVGSVDAGFVEGLDAADQALGASGKIVPIADPQQLADAALSLLNDPAAWQAASQAAIARVERYYTDTMMFDRYRAVYDKAFQQAQGAH